MLIHVATAFIFPMATTRNNLVSSILMLGLLTFIFVNPTVAQVGVCYGRLGNNLPSPSDVVSLYKKNNITKMRIYDPHEPTLQALRGSDIEVMIGIPDVDLPALANCECFAHSWVQGNITSYPTVKFRYIVVGNEVHPASQYAQFVLPAMQNIYNAVCKAGLESQIEVSTSFKADVLSKSYPPQEGEFKSNFTWYIKPILQFLRNTSSPLLANVYPYFAYLEDPEHISLSFALLQPCSGVYAGGVYYDNLFYAILDAFYAAMEKLMGAAASVQQSSGKSDKDIVVSETGRSTKHGHHTMSLGDESPTSIKNARIYNNNVKKGTPKKPGKLQGKILSADDESTATVENARIYNNNLMRVVKKGTPKRPDSPIEAYIFAMFDENEKTGDVDERYFGIFDASGKPKYPLRFY